MERRKALVPTGPERRRTGREVSAAVRHRGGVLLADEQLEKGAAARSNEEFREGQRRRAPPVALLIAFTRAFIKLHPGDDAIYLAITQAQSEVEVTDGELAVFIDAIYGEARDAVWPKDMF